MSRFQESSLPVRLWRCRHLLPVPFHAFSDWWVHNTEFAKAWGLAVGNAHYRMEWFFYWNEVEEHLALNRHCPQCGCAESRVTMHGDRAVDGVKIPDTMYVRQCTQCGRYMTTVEDVAEYEECLKDTDEWLNAEDEG